MKRKSPKLIAYLDNILSYETSLPLPVVHYPGSYGAFLSFSETNDSKQFFCSCVQSSINNYIKIRQRENYIQHPFTYGVKEFPKEIIESVLINKYSFNDVPNMLLYKDNICHACLRKIPNYSYCNPMYGGVFKRTYGWYIRAKSYEWGIEPDFANVILVESIPDELIYIYNSTLLPVLRKIKQEQASDREHFDVQSELMKARRTFFNIVENEVREITGYKKIGEGWISETQLFYIIKDIYPQYEILRHFRPKFLEYLELDIFIPELNLGIEYQGQQHYMAIDHWGGQKALIATQLRDKRKESLCKRNKIKLVKFDFNENLSNSYVKKKLQGNSLAKQHA